MDILDHLRHYNCLVLLAVLIKISAFLRILKCLTEVSNSSALKQCGSACCQRHFISASLLHTLNSTWFLQHLILPVNFVSPLLVTQNLQSNKQISYHMVRHPRCVFINCNWINQLSNTTIWWLDICCLLHRYQLHVPALMDIFKLIDWQQTCKQLYFGMRLVYGGGGLGLDVGKRYRVCWVGRVMWVHGYYCAGLS